MSLLGAKLRIARTAGALARRSGRGGGTSLPGKLLLRMQSDALELLSARLPQGSAVISATNGKTTTATMAAAILEARGTALVRNHAGANMAGGIATTLAGAARRRGINGELGLFEVDEFWLPRLVQALQPRVLALGNLFRDQLDRYGELDAIAENWARMLSEQASGTGPRLVLNADDPLIADLGEGRADVTYFGIEDPAIAVPELPHASDSKHCRRCGTPYVYDAVYLGHMGNYRCPSCGRERPQPSVSAQQITLHGARRTTFMLVTPQGSRAVLLALPGLYNVYNAVAAAALCLKLGATLAQVVAGLEASRAAFGRGQEVVLDTAVLELLLIKNPAGANEIVRTLTLEPSEIDVLIALNDRTADGRDVSWVWDADFELLAAKLRSVTCTGTRAAEMALRLKYAGVETDRIRVVGELPAALDAALASSEAERLFVLPTYTAMLELQHELAARGHVAHYWERAA